MTVSNCKQSNNIGFMTYPKAAQINQMQNNQFPSKMRLYSRIISFSPATTRVWDVLNSMSSPERLKGKSIQLLYKHKRHLVKKLIFISLTNFNQAMIGKVSWTGVITILTPMSPAKFGFKNFFLANEFGFKIKYLPSHRNKMKNLCLKSTESSQNLSPAAPGVDQINIDSHS